MPLQRGKASAGAIGTVLSSVTPAASEEYHSRFSNWDRRASVRTKPRRSLAEGNEGTLYFPSELLPVVRHPLVAARGPEAVRRILIQRLYHYLHFTAELEQAVVMPVTMMISRGQSGLHLPVDMRVDAFRITTDEAWHAQFSFDLFVQVQAHTGVAPRLPERPQFLHRVGDIRRRMDPDLRGAEDLLFSVVSETLISTILCDLPKDARLPQAVRDLVADHAEDEGKHHAYFRTLLREFWPAATPDERRRLGPYIPDLIRAFLEPDYQAVSYSLFDTGFSQPEVEQVMVESYPPERVSAAVAADARATVRYFLEAGALDDPATRDAFATGGLL